jgi:protein tyrosine phosphatase (PTP) superfamily phosphohydrolase (DUF442 family)
MAYTEIAPNLYVSGAEDVERWKSIHPAGICVSCCAITEWATLRYCFDDDIGGMSKAERADAEEAARQVQLYRSSRAVLVFCSEGRNRSCLVAALALIDGGMDRTEALALVRARRSPALRAGIALSNPYFVNLIERGSL